MKHENYHYDREPRLQNWWATFADADRAGSALVAEGLVLDDRPAQPNARSEVRSHGDKRDDFQHRMNLRYQTERMNIELKQAAQDAAEAIDWLLKNIRLDAPQLSGKAMGHRKHWP